MVQYKIRVDQLNALAFAVKHFNGKIPTKWKAISHFVNVRTRNGNGIVKTVIGTGSICRPFDGSAVHCKDVSQILHSTNNRLLLDTQKQDSEILHSDNSNTSAMKPVILLPVTETCIFCTNKQLSRIDSRIAFPHVFTQLGTTIAAAYHGRCDTCSTSYFHSYYEKDGKRYYYKNALESEYLQVTNKTVFSVKYLRDVSNKITIGKVAIESCCEIYNENYGEESAARLKNLENFKRNGDVTWELNEARLQQGFYTYHLLKVFSEHGVTDEVFFNFDNVSRRRDIDELCSIAWDLIRQSPSPWIDHVCDVPGCKEGYASLDGNEKLYRPICKAKKTYLKLGKSMANMIQCCPNSPVFGGKHQAASPFCVEHSGLKPIEDELCKSDTKKRKASTEGFEPASKLAKISVGNNGESKAVPGQGNLVFVINLKDMKCFPKDPELIESVKSLPDNDDTSVHVGCKSAKDVDKFYSRTAGILALVRPCGVIIDFAEMYTCESPTQVMVFLLRVCSKNWKRFKYIGYDRGCELKPFLVNLAKKGNEGAKLLLSNLKLAVDIWHIIKHVREECMPLKLEDGSYNPKCEFHPRLPKFSEIHGANTESAEQTFHFTNGFKHSMRKMQQYKYNFFFWIVQQSRNKMLTRTKRK